MTAPPEVERKAPPAERSLKDEVTVQSLLCWLLVMRSRDLARLVRLDHPIVSGAIVFAGWLLWNKTRGKSLTSRGVLAIGAVVVVAFGLLDYAPWSTIMDWFRR